MASFSYEKKQQKVAYARKKLKLSSEMGSFGVHLPDDWPFIKMAEARAKNDFAGKMSAYIRALIERDLAGATQKPDATDENILVELCERLRPEIAAELTAILQKADLSQPKILANILEQLASFYRKSPDYKYEIRITRNSFASPTLRHVDGTEETFEPKTLSRSPAINVSTAKQSPFPQQEIDQLAALTRQAIAKANAKKLTADASPPAHIALRKK